MKSSQELLNKPPKALVKHYSTSTTTTGQNEQKLPPTLVETVNYIFGVFKLTWGRKYASRFKSVTEINNTKRQWARSFMRLGLTEQEVKAAVDMAVDAAAEWPPELPDFLALCYKTNLTDLPDKDDVYKQIVDRHGRVRNEKNFQWLHDIVNVIDRDVGRYVTTESERQFKVKFNKAWEKRYRQYRQGTLPTPKVALPSPDLPPVVPMTEIDPNCPLQKKIAELRGYRRD
jgi:hypothetical protein